MAVCRYHGGSTGHIRRAAERRLAAEEVRATVGLLGVAEDISPEQALLREIQRAAGSVTLLAAVVDGLDTTEATAASVWTERLDTERDRLVRYSDLAVRAGLEHRRVRLAEAMGNQVVAVLQGVLGQLELSPAQLQRAAEVMPNALRQLVAVAS